MTLKQLEDTWMSTIALCGAQSESAQNAKRAYVAQLRKNTNRNLKHRAYTDLGMKRVRGALGGVYYE